VLVRFDHVAGVVVFVFAELAAAYRASAACDGFGFVPNTATNGYTYAHGESYSYNKASSHAATWPYSGRCARRSVIADQLSVLK
jgi:hypothetical protein